MVEWNEQLLILLLIIITYIITSNYLNYYSKEIQILDRLVGFHWTNGGSINWLR